MSHQLRIAAFSDPHYSMNKSLNLEAVYRDASFKADVIVICGDLTDTGTLEEAMLVAKDARVATVPVLCVLGNHDFDSGQSEQIRSFLLGSGIHVLDGTSIEINNVGIAGIKGFGGGFNPHAIPPRGEATTKLFAQEAIAEATKLDVALSAMTAAIRVVLLHYSPIKSTVEGEPIETNPFLGSSHLEEVIDRHPCNLILHGHAHQGAPSGITTKGKPVYNVCLSVLQRLSPSMRYRMIEVGSTLSHQDCGL
jgi:Icc-related predicted phosphoesterase